jgi:hypothetical protein
MAPNVTLEHLLARWIVFKPLSPIICDLEMLFLATTFPTHEVRSSRCSFQHAFSLGLSQRDAMIPLFPFVFFSIKIIGTMWGKQMLHLNCCT